MMSSQSRLLGMSAENSEKEIEWMYEGRGSLPLGEGAVEEPGDDGEVLALVVGGQDDRVLLLGDSHFDDVSTDSGDLSLVGVRFRR